MLDPNLERLSATEQWTALKGFDKTRGNCETTFEYKFVCMQDAYLLLVTDLQRVYMKFSQDDDIRQDVKKYFTGIQAKTTKMVQSTLMKILQYKPESAEFRTLKYTNNNEFLTLTCEMSIKVLHLTWVFECRSIGPPDVQSRFVKKHIILPLKRKLAQLTGQPLPYEQDIAEPDRSKPADDSSQSPPTPKSSVSHDGNNQTPQEIQSAGEEEKRSSISGGSQEQPNITGNENSEEADVLKRLEEMDKALEKEREIEQRKRKRRRHFA